MFINTEFICSRLTKGISIINSLPTKKFQLLLSHIVSSNSGDLFTPEELKKLRDSLRISEEDVMLLLHSINYILKQSTRIILKPTTLEKHFKEHLKLDDEKSTVFTQIWSNETKKEVGNFGELMKLDDLAWEQNIKIADQICNEQEVSFSRLQLSVSSSCNDKKERINLELDEEELLHLYNTLEAIQMKLDNLSS